MPTTIGSFLLFVVLLTPGFVYLNRTETRLPSKKYTVLRETATIVSVSTIVYGVVLGVFSGLRVLLSDNTPDIGALVRGPKEYLTSNYLYVSLWGLVLFVLAVLIAALCAVPPAWVQQILERSQWSGTRRLASAIGRRRRGRIVQESGWSTAFLRYPDCEVYVGLRLVDGTYIYGALGGYNAQVDETDTRSLQLFGPVDIRTPSSDEENITTIEAGAMIVSASHIKTIAVHYKDVNEREDGLAIH